ncbi:MAG: formylglycine-generating enzyme family protein [Planctomycetota bacterium]
MCKRLIVSLVCVIGCLMQAETARTADITSCKEFTNSLGMKLIRIEAGTFMMGWDGAGEGEREHGDFDEEPRHQVTITQPFYMAKAEVTIDQFRQFKAEYPGYDKFRPYASAISWDEAAAFCEWLTKRECKPYRLPTEAEWEYACRAGTATPFSSGKRPPEHFFRQPATRARDG